MHRLPAHIAKRCVILKRQATATQAAVNVVLLPMEKLKSSNKKDIIDVLSIHPSAVVADTCPSRMVALAKYAMRFDAPFQSHNMMKYQASEMWNYPYQDASLVITHILLDSINDMRVTAEILDGMVSTLDIVPGAELNLALQTSQKLKCKFFYCLDSHVNTLLHRVYHGMSWSEMREFIDDLGSVLDAVYRRDQGTAHMQSGDAELLRGASTLLRRKYPWVHHVCVEERAKIIGIRIKELCAKPPVHVEPEPVAKADAEAGEAGQKERKEQPMAKAKESEPEPEPYTVVAFVGKALLPGIITEWCTDRTKEEMYVLHKELTSRSTDLVKGGLMLYANKAKQIRKEHEVACAAQQETPEQRLARQLNTFRGERFDSAYPFQDTDFMPSGARGISRGASGSNAAGGGNGAVAAPPQGSRNAAHAVSPFDVMYQMGKTYDSKSAVHSRLRR